MMVDAIRPVALACLFLNLGVEASGAHDQPRPLRQAQCLLEINGSHHWGGECTFAALDRQGSFQITTPSGLSAKVKVWINGQADGFWSGPRRGREDALPLGELYSRKMGCWSDEDDDANTICAWGKDARVYSGPLPERKDDLAWGERTGMSARIITRFGLDTKHATITAEKERGGAVEWCRSNGDYSQHCIDDTLNGGPVPRQATIHANCRTKRFTDFWGTEHRYVGNKHILDVATNEEAEGSAGNWGVAYTAIKALCPKTSESPASSR